MNPPENFAMGEDGAMIGGQEEPNPFLANNPDAAEQPKPKRKMAYSLKSENLVEPGVGLDQLYIKSVIFGKK